MADGTILHVSFFPDARAGLRGMENRSLESRNPVLAGFLRNAAGDTLRFEVKPESEQQAGPYTVAFPMLRYWSQFSVGNDPGHAWLACGVFACVLGLVLRMLFTYVRLFMSIASSPEGATVTIFGAGEKNLSMLTERLEELGSSIPAMLAIDPPGKGTRVGDPI
jgi:hypothetical protein